MLPPDETPSPTSARSFRSKGAEHLQYLTPVAVRSAIGRTKLHPKSCPALVVPTRREVRPTRRDYSLSPKPSARPRPSPRLCWCRGESREFLLRLGSRG